MPAKIANGNILNSRSKYIAHQCNCVTSNSAGVAKVIFNKFPYSNVYEGRSRFSHWSDTADKPGDITVCGNGVGERYVINMMAQIYPGAPKFPDSKSDGFDARIKYFNKCLNKISRIDNLHSIAFPFGTGCSLAGGDWKVYHGMIDAFADYVNAKVFLVKLEK